MKKIINGRKYDTETATLIGQRTENMGSFNYIHEELYKKKTGEFFLYGVGGAASKYRSYCGSNTYSDGEAITPFTEDEAKRWAESNMTVDEYENEFGEVEE